MIREIPQDDFEKQEVLKRMQDNMKPACTKLQQFLSEVDQYCI